MRCDISAQLVNDFSIQKIKKPFSSREISVCTWNDINCCPLLCWFEITCSNMECDGYSIKTRTLKNKLINQKLSFFHSVQRILNFSYHPWEFDIFHEGERICKVTWNAGLNEYMGVRTGTSCENEIIELVRNWNPYNLKCHHFFYCAALKFQNHYSRNALQMVQNAIFCWPKNWKYVVHSTTFGPFWITNILQQNEVPCGP